MNELQIWQLVLYGLMVLVVVAGMIGLAFILGERRRFPGRAGREPYESGMPLTHTAHMRIPVQFYLIAMLFVIFDLEAVFIFAWAIVVREAGWLGFWAMGVFIGILFIALLYEWRVGALDWGPMTLLSGVAIGSMFLGNWSALLQDNIKRLLAYSSIAHMGYLLVAFLASGAVAVEAVGYYLVAYIPTMLGAFGVVQALSHPGNDADSLEQYRGLLWRNPGLAVMLIIMMLSLAGIPLTAGFLAKFYVVTAGLTAQLWMLVVLFILNSVIGLFYYLRIIRFLISDAPAQIPSTGFPVSLPLGTTLTLGSLTVFVILFGIYPDPVMHLLQHFGEQLAG